MSAGREDGVKIVGLLWRKRRGCGALQSGFWHNGEAPKKQAPKGSREEKISETGPSMILSLLSNAKGIGQRTKRRR
jgi:hypothetical protein